MIKGSKIQRSRSREKCKDNRARRILPLLRFSVSQKSCHVWSSNQQQFGCLSISLYHCDASYSFHWRQICFNCSIKHQNVSGRLSYRNKATPTLTSHLNVKRYNVILAILWSSWVLVFQVPHFLQKNSSLSVSWDILSTEAPNDSWGVLLCYSTDHSFLRLCFLSDITHSISHKCLSNKMTLVILIWAVYLEQKQMDYY